MESKYYFFLHLFYREKKESKSMYDKIPALGQIKEIEILFSIPHSLKYMHKNEVTHIHMCP